MEENQQPKSLADVSPAEFEAAAAKQAAEHVPTPFGEVPTPPEDEKTFEGAEPEPELGPEDIMPPVQIKRWRSHKCVDAARIRDSVQQAKNGVPCGAMLYLEPEHADNGDCPELPAVEVDQGWVDRHPRAFTEAGYFVRYDDGYTSWSPAKPFEEGYRGVDEYAPLLELPSDLHPAAEHVMKFFTFMHLPPHLRAVSEPFAALAHTVAATAPQSPETTVALRRLLEAKDAAVRAVL